MSSIDDILKQASLDAVSHLGETAYINGLKVTGVFFDDEFQDEYGPRTLTTLSIAPKYIKIFNVGDEVIIKGTKYTVKNIPNLKDHLFKIELNRA